MTLAPRPYQEEGIVFLEEKERALLADEPGIGKSMQALRAARGKTLVVAPAMVIDGGVWDDEWAKWRPDLDLHQISYSSLCERVTEVRPSDGRKIARVIPRPRVDVAGPWDTVIFDESHYLKDRKALWTQAAEKIKTDRLYQLSGSPIPNWAWEIYMALRLIFPGDRRFTSFWRWLQEWFEINITVQRGRTIREPGDLRSEFTWEEFREANSVNDRMLMRFRADVLGDLPPLTEQEIKLTMTPTQKVFYEKLKKDYIAWVDETGEEVSAWSAGGLHSKLQRIQTGIFTVTQEDMPIPRLLAGSNKLQMLDEIIKNHSDGPLVVFCQYRATAAAVRKLSEERHRRRSAILWGKQSKGDRRETVLNFRKGDIDILVGTLDTITEGLTLTEASTCVFVERSWRPTRNDQAKRRLHRMGQLLPVLAIFLLSRNALDSRMGKVLRSKTEQQMEFLKAGEFAALL